ncbi:MAG: hypothetical protein ACREET_03160 [Stellaceae bacterium]
MTRWPALLAGCVVCAGLILIEFGSIGDHGRSSGARLPATEIKPGAPGIQKLADPAHDAEPRLRDARLTGIVIGPDSRIAIFAVTGIGPLVLSEGEALKDWRLDSISLERVVLSGPAGSIVLEPKPDANLARPSPPAMADAPAQPVAVTPVAVSSSAAASVQTPGSPSYFPGNYAAYDYPSYDSYAYPYFPFAVPISAGFGFGFFHHRDFNHRGFHRGAFRGGAFKGGAFRGSAFQGGGFHGGGSRGHR